MASRDLFSAVVHHMPSLWREVEKFFQSHRAEPFETFSIRSTWDAGEQEQDFIRNVIPHLRNATENFKVLATILLDYDESKKRALQQVTLQGKQSLDLADSAASAQLSVVDQYTESLTAMKGQLDQQQRDKSKDLENLKTERKSIADCVERCREALDNSRRSLNSARETLRDLERKRENSETVRDVGIVLMFTIIGTIPGAIMAIVSQEEIDEANRSIRTAEEEVDDCKAEIQKYDKKLEEKKSQCRQKKDEIAACSRAVEQIQQSLDQVKVQRKSITRTQEKLRSAVHVLSTLAGRASVARTLTERVVCLPTVANTLGEIIQLMLETQGDRKYQLLEDPHVKAAIRSLEEVYQKVSAIDDKQTLKEIDFYC